MVGTGCKPCVRYGPLRQVEEDVWLVSFMDYDMAYFDMESHKVSALENPFGPKVLGM
jgi:putative transposase